MATMLTKSPCCGSYHSTIKTSSKAVTARHCGCNPGMRSRLNWLSCFYTDYIKRYATAEVLRQGEEDSSSSASEMSDLSDDEIQDMEL